MHAIGIVSLLCALALAAPSDSTNQAQVKRDTPYVRRGYIDGWIEYDDPSGPIHHGKKSPDPPPGASNADAAIKRSDPAARNNEDVAVKRDNFPNTE